MSKRMRLELEAREKFANIPSLERFLEFNRQLVRMSSLGLLRDDNIAELPSKIEGGEMSNGSESTDVNINNGKSGLKIKMDFGVIRKLFECPVCFEILLPPMTLCNNGHFVCNSCRGNLRSCPSCQSQFTEVRNRFAEEFLDKCLVKCKYAERGCQAELSGRKLSAHYEVCNHRPDSSVGKDEVNK